MTGTHTMPSITLESQIAFHRQQLTLLLKQLPIGKRRVVNMEIWNAIVREVTAIFGIEPEDLTGNSRKMNIVAARRCCAFIAFANGYTVSKIGRFINRDHTCILIYLNDYKLYFKQRPELRGFANAVEVKFKIQA